MPPSTGLPTDPDVDLHVSRPRWELRRAPWAVLTAVSAGGVVGASARHSVDLAWPHLPGTFPGATFVVNVSGCLLIGVLMVLITDVWSAHRLLRPFLGVGVLGGFTTFSTAMVEVPELMGAGRPALALLYLVGSAVGALLAAALGVVLARAVGGRRGRGRR